MRAHLTRQPRRMAVGAIGLLAGAALVLSACGSTTSPSAPPPATVGAATIGTLGAVLTGSNGSTLYYLSTETESAFQCTGGCTSTWHPYEVASGTAPTAAAGVHGTVSTTQRPGGSTQVTFNSHPVYFYVGDSASGQATGEGADGVWFVLKTSFGTSTAPTSTPPTSTSTPQANGY